MQLYTKNYNYNYTSNETRRHRAHAYACITHASGHAAVQVKPVLPVEIGVVASGHGRIKSHSRVSRIMERELELVIIM